MSKRDQQILLAVVGLGLIAIGHKLTDAEFGELGVPHVAGAALFALALRI